MTGLLQALELLWDKQKDTLITFIMVSIPFSDFLKMLLNICRNKPKRIKIKKLDKETIIM
jgi:hypothetical protein